MAAHVRRLRAPCLVVLLSACWAGPDRVLDLPPRPEGAALGSEVASEVRELGLAAREERFYGEVSSGNVPPWLRRLRPVEVTGRVDGVEHRVTFWVTPDYVAAGSADDYLHLPLTPQTAQRVADLFGGSLPTPRMVDAIWASARVRLSPQRIQPRDSIQSVRTVESFERHTRLIEAQRRVKGVPVAAFVAGHKKDVVLSATLSANPGKVAIYGWHRPDGRPIQPLSTVVIDRWVFYHHGVRVVDRTVVVDGRTRDLHEVLRDPRVAPLLSDEGVITRPRYPLGVTEP